MSGTSRKGTSRKQAGGKQGPGRGGASRPGSRKPAASRTASGRPGASRSPGVSPRRRRRLLAVVLGACVAVAALVAAAAVTLGGGHRTDEVATLDGHTVTRAELLFHMRRLAPTVQNELRNKYHLAPTFSWNTEAGGKTALRRLESRAFDEIREDRTVLLLARRQGLTESVDFADLEAERAEENTSRARGVAAGQTVYGVTEFSSEEYYTHRLTELTTSLKDRLSEDSGDPLHVTDAEVREAFEADPDSWSANATTYTYTRLVVPVPDGAGDDFATALQRRVKAAGRLSAVTGEPHAKLTTDTYGGSGTTGLSTHDQDLMAVLGELEPGQVSGPVKGTGQVTFYQLDRESTDADKAFTAYSSRIRQSLVDKKFDTYLQRRADDASLHVDASAVAAINAKDVQQ